MDLMKALECHLGANGILTGEDACAPYLTGARYGAGRAPAVLLPRTIAQAAAVLATLHDDNAQFVVQGANTGLVGASTPDGSGRQYLVSFDKLKGEIAIDPVERTATVTAGTRLSELNEAASKHGLCFPIDLGADPTIGGMIATNTGGARLIKYGDVRANLCSVDAWCPSAGRSVLTLGTELRKSNTGLDLKQLLCGSSGALGVVLSATVRLHPLPRQRASALVVPRSMDAMMKLIVELERVMPELLASAEGMSGKAMEAVFRHIPSVRNPFTNGAIPDYAVLIELVSCLTSDMISLPRVLEGWLESMLERELVSDACFGDEDAFWRIRHGISEAIRAEGKVIAFDVSLPRRRLAEFREWGRAYLATNHPEVRICDFGHVVDGGLHFNLVVPRDAAGDWTQERTRSLRTAVLDKAVRDFGGSYSAEHGVGPYNREFYERYTSNDIRRLSGEIRHIFAPGSRCGNVKLD